MPKRPACRFTLLALIACTIGVPARSDDVFVPPWRGEDGTTYQHWRFDTSQNPASPEDADNPYGDPTARITVGQFGEGWFHALPGLGSKTGFWDLGGTGGSIVCDVPVEAGTPQVVITSDPDWGSVVDQVVVDTLALSDRKGHGQELAPHDLPTSEIWVQVTYFVDITRSPSVTVPGGEYLGGERVVVEEVQTGGKWMLDQSVWRLVVREPPPQVPDFPPSHM